MGDLIILDEKREQGIEISWTDANCPNCKAELVSENCGGAKCIGDEVIVAEKLVCKNCGLSSKPFLY